MMVELFSLAVLRRADQVVMISEKMHSIFIQTADHQSGTVRFNTERQRDRQHLKVALERQHCVNEDESPISVYHLEQL